MPCLNLDFLRTQGIDLCMITDDDIKRVVKKSAKFKPALLGARYHAASDQIELNTEWCTIRIDRKQIDELRNLSKKDLKTLAFSPFGIHIDNADVDISAEGLLADIAEKLSKFINKSI